LKDTCHGFEINRQNRAGQRQHGGVGHEGTHVIINRRTQQALVDAVGAPEENISAWNHDILKENLGVVGGSAMTRG
jgi:hypothetical protein